MGKHTINTEQYLLRMDVDTKRRLREKSKVAGVSLADAFRIGGERYLDSLIEDHSDDSLLNEFVSIAARVQNNMRGSH